MRDVILRLQPNPKGEEIWSEKSMCAMCEIGAMPVTGGSFLRGPVAGIGCKYQEKYSGKVMFYSHMYSMYTRTVCPFSLVGDAGRTCSSFGSGVLGVFG